MKICFGMTDTKMLLVDKLIIAKKEKILKD